MDKVTRREAVRLIAGAGAVVYSGCSRAVIEESSMPNYAAVNKITPLPAGTSPWPTRDPFLFCVHHLDRYPRGNAKLGPDASLAGRVMGQDFAGIDGWRMYHGDTVPGFPSHPHRGFETVTVVREGLLDHADSLGAAARYGEGDVQWLTAGAGIQHAEMFPLLKQEEENPVELFQIWLNLPKARKFAKPHFAMFWNDSVPSLELQDETGRSSRIRLIAGGFNDQQAPQPPPESWASNPDNDVAIWTIRLSAGAQVTLPPARPGALRSLYFFQGDKLEVNHQQILSGNRVDVAVDLPTLLSNGEKPSQVLVLQGRPINEPVVQYGPFVMNSRAEIHEAMSDYRRTGFGGWPWDRDDPVHGADSKRFARHIDGRHEEPV
jgi:redox-sensitive bicupin YhaK (pirin superfamily)